MYKPLDIVEYVVANCGWASYGEVKNHMIHNLFHHGMTVEEARDDLFETFLI